MFQGHKTRVIAFALLVMSVMAEKTSDMNGTSGGLAITSTTKVTEKPETKAFTTSSWGDDSSWLTTASDDWSEDVCYDEPLLQNHCSVPDDMRDVTFWDLYSVLFSDTVIDALIFGCPKGTWCLQDKFDEWEALISERADIVMHSEVADSMCKPDIELCTEDLTAAYKNCSVFAQMEYTTQSFELVCKLKGDPSVTSQCLKHTLTSLHVTLADVLRMQSDVKPVGNTAGDDFCKSAEAHMTQGLLCMYNSCPEHALDFTEFTPWSWFTSVVDDVITNCQLDPENCTSLIQVGETDRNVSSITSTSSPQQTSTSSETSLTSAVNGTSNVSTSTASTMMITSSAFKTSSYYVTTTESHEDAVQHPYSNLYHSDVSMLAGVTVATMVTASILLVLLVIVYRRHRRNVVIKEGYQKLLNDGEES